MYPYNLFPEDEAADDRFTRDYDFGYNTVNGQQFSPDDDFFTAQSPYPGRYTPPSHGKTPSPYPGQDYRHPSHPDKHPGHHDKHPSHPDKHPGHHDKYPSHPDKHPGNPHSHPDDRHNNHGKNEKAPQGPPPSYTPNQSHGVRAVDPGSIKGCLYRYVYIWLKNGQSFWLYPTYVGRHSISGYRWTYFGWAYVGYDLSMIDNFICAK